ncbi:MAG: glycosyltransferase [Alcaligenaceae bacterium]|nr:glycosyltransferase [Alcaligenaceae bacterium]
MIAPTVAILLCTYQGQDYLAEQLASYGTQTHGQWTVHASDDGSADATLSILEAWKAHRLDRPSSAPYDLRKCAGTEPTRRQSLHRRC